jgi:hypothetical protein
MTRGFSKVSARPITDYVYDSAAMIHDPTGVLEAIRDAGEIVWSPAMRRWLVLSRSAAEEALKTPDLRVHDLFGNFERIEQRTGIDLADLLRVSDWIPFLHDGPRHGALRAAFARLLADLRGPYLDAFAEGSHQMLSALREAGGGDLATDYADRLHVEAIGRLAGFAPEHRQWIARITASQGSIDFGASVSEMQDINARGAALVARLEAIADPTGPFMERIGRALRASGVEDGPARRVDCLAALLLLGRDTLAGTVTLGLAHLLDAGGGTFGGPITDDTGALADELIRLSSAVQIVIRVAARDLTLAGQPIAKGEHVIVFLHAANRDPAVFACPHAVQAGQGSHLAFGAARHLCTGRPLARDAFRIVLSQFAELGYVHAVPGGRTMGLGRNTRKLQHLHVRMTETS